MQTRWIEVADGVSLAADLWPAAPGADPGPGGPVPFVLVHGLASNARMWDGVAVRVAGRGHPVVTVDLRGHGRSSKPDGPYDVPTVADDVAALVTALDLPRPVIAGQSWGGNVVLELAARHGPDLARGIACVDGGWLEPSAAFPSWEACLEVLAPPRLAGMPRDAIEARIRAAHPDWPETGIEGALANFERRPDGTVAPWLTYERHVAILRGLWDHHPPRRYPDVRVPVLLLPADDGDPDRHARRLGEVDLALATLPAAHVHRFDGDHDIHAQRPADVAGVMLDHLDTGFLA
jgi:pimeloyl-ACP methyl ester carboxylesterase